MKNRDILSKIGMRNIFALKSDKIFNIILFIICNLVYFEFFKDSDLEVLKLFLKT